MESTHKTWTQAFKRYFDNLVAAAMSDDYSKIITRSCGTCTLCCTAPAIEESHRYIGMGGCLPVKAAGRTCERCTGGGCNVYDNRPELCRGYACFYVTTVLETHPEESGICWSLEPDMQSAPGKPCFIIAGHCMSVTDALAVETTRNDIKFMLGDKGPHTDTKRPTAVIVRSPYAAIRLVPDGNHRMVQIDSNSKLRNEFLRETETAASETLGIQEWLY